MEVEKARFATQNNVENKTMKTSKYLSRALAVTVLGCLGVSAAKAAMVNYLIGDGGLESFNITYSYASGQNTTIDGALAGGIAITKVAGGAAPNGFRTSYTTVCTDIGGTVYLGSTYGYDQTGYSGLNGVRPNWGLNAYDNSLSSAQLQNEQQEAIQNAAEIFYNNFNYLTTGTTDQKAALQLAVWAALYDTGQNGNVAVNLTSGNLIGARFTANESGGDQAAINLAAAWLAGLDGNYGLTGNLLYPDPTYQGNVDGEPVQELLIRTQDADPVPEPTTMVAGALLLLPFGASTLRVLRKNRAA
jgi:hypothetical protein